MANARDEALYDSVSPVVIYQYVSLIDEDNLRSEDSLIKCPLCNHFARNFYCVDCIRNGNFTHSKKKCFERFADKKPKKYKTDAEKSIIIKRYENALSKKKEIENLKLNIYTCRENIQLLKKSIECCQDEISKGEKAVKETREQKSRTLSEQKKLSEKLAKLGECNEALHVDVGKVEAKLVTKRTAVSNVLHTRIQELVTHIFPIVKVPSQHSRDTSSSEEGPFAELEEAQKTTFVQGQWVITGSPTDDVQYSIVEPCLPSTGDYSAYTAWCAEHSEAVCRDTISSAYRYQFDVAYGINAALAYTAQMVNILSFYFDVHVPKRSNFSDFCKSETPEKFLHHVAKLNANVVHLCLARKVDVARLSSHRTINNLLLLLDTKDADRRRSLPWEEKEDLLESLEESITKDLLPLEDSDSEESLEAEFVHVSDDEDLLDAPEPEEPPAPIPASFVSSVFSLWKAATGQK